MGNVHISTVYQTLGLLLRTHTVRNNRPPSSIYRHLAMSVARRFSTSSSALQMVKPPVAVYGVEGRYATALYSAASKQKALYAVEKDLSAFAAQIQKDKKLQDFLHDPSVNKALKADGKSATPSRPSWPRRGGRSSARSHRPSP